MLLSQFLFILNNAFCLSMLSYNNIPAATFFYLVVFACYILVLFFFQSYNSFFFALRIAELEGGGTGTNVGQDQ